MPEIYFRIDGNLIEPNRIKKLKKHIEINKDSIKVLEGLIKVTKEILDNFYQNYNLDIEVNFCALGKLGFELSKDPRIDKEMIEIRKDRFKQTIGRRITEDLLLDNYKEQKIIYLAILD